MSNKKNDKESEMLRKRLRQRRLALDLTYQDISSKTGMSVSTLQRYESGGIKSIAYDRIVKLAEVLEVPISYFTDLSKDYTGKEDFTSEANQDKSALRKEMEHFENKAIARMAPKLISEGYSIGKRITSSPGDIVVTKGKEVWHIDFVYIKDGRKKGMNKKQDLLFRFGRLAIYDKPITKYSMLFERQKDAEDYLKVKPIHLDLDVSILWLKEDGYEELFYHE